jgi:hypothetical protein
MMLAIDLLGPASSPSDQEKLHRWLEEFNAAQVPRTASFLIGKASVKTKHSSSVIALQIL